MKNLILFLCTIIFCTAAQGQVRGVKHVILIGCDGLGARAIPSCAYVFRKETTYSS